MTRALKRRLALGVSVAALLSGGAIAAVSATGQNDAASPVFAHRGRHPGTADLLHRASAYLGIAPAQLKGRLESGQTLAQVAEQTSGKSEAGLVAALVSARSAKLAKAQSQVDARVRAAVNRPLFGRGGGFRAGALGYLGLTVAQLKQELRSGKTLAEIANASSGRSRAGLVAAIVAARSTRLSTEVSSGKLSKAGASTDLERFTKRVQTFVDRSHLKRKSG